MKRNLKFAVPMFALLIAASLCLVACGGSKATQVAIPAEAQIVFAVNPSSLMEKVTYKQMEELAFFKFLQAEAAKEGKDTQKAFELITSLMQKPENTGLNMSQMLYGYMANLKGDNGSRTYIGITGSLKDAGKFESLLKDKLKQTGIEKKDGVSMLKMQEDAQLVWTDDRMLLLIAENFNGRATLQANALTYIKYKKDDGLNKNDDFRTFVGTVKDMGAWSSMASFADEIPEKQLQDVGLTLDDIRQNYVHTLVAFNKGEMTWETDVVWSKGLKKAFKTMAGKEIGKDVFKYVPAQNLVGCFGFSLNLKNMLANVREMGKKNKELGTALPMADLGLIQFGLSLDKITEIMSGIVFIAVTDLKVEYPQTASGENTMALDDARPMPSVLLAYGVNDSKKFQEILDKAVSPSMPITKEGNLYKVKVGGGDVSELWYTYVDKYLLVSNDKAIVEQATKGGYSKDKQVSADVAKLADGPLMAYMNLNADKLPADVLKNPMMKTLVQEMGVDFMSMDNNGDYVRASLKFKDSAASSLLGLLKLGDAAVKMGIEANSQAAMRAMDSEEDLIEASAY